MNKETVLLVTAMLTVTCIVCFARDKILESKNQPAASSVSESAESEDSMTSVSPDIDINFNSGNDVESISDEKLRSIANHDFKTADFVQELIPKRSFSTLLFGLTRKQTSRRLFLRKN